MRALIFDGHELKLDSVARPQLNEGQALLKIRRAGICNTDLELIKGYMNYTGILGHEFVAEVVDGPDTLIGKRVVGEINVADGTCSFCQHDIPSQCLNRTTVGIDRHPGAFAEYLALTTHNLHIVPDSVSDDAAVFVEPLAAALQVTEAVHISPCDRVFVLGLGKLGLLVAQVLRLTGADVTGIIRRQEQEKLLRQWQIPALMLDALPEHEADVVVDCTGTSDGFGAALELVKARGTIVLKSTYTELPQADLTRVVVDEIRVVGSRCGPFDAALRLLEAGLIEVTSLIEARYPLDDAIPAFAHAGRRGALKILLDYN